MNDLGWIRWHFLHLVAAMLCVVPHTGVTLSIHVR